jgi:hypothetical protein
MSFFEVRISCFVIACILVALGLVAWGIWDLARYK